MSASPELMSRPDVVPTAGQINDVLHPLSATPLLVLPEVQVSAAHNTPDLSYADEVSADKSRVSWTLSKREWDQFDSAVASMDRSKLPVELSNDEWYGAVNAWLDKETGTGEHAPKLAELSELPVPQPEVDSRPVIKHGAAKLAARAEAWEANRPEPKNKPNQDTTKPASVVSRARKLAKSTVRKGKHTQDSSRNSVEATLADRQLTGEDLLRAYTLSPGRHRAEKRGRTKAVASRVGRAMLGGVDQFSHRVARKVDRAAKVVDLDFDAVLARASRVRADALRHTEDGKVDKQVQRRNLGRSVVAAVVLSGVVAGMAPAAAHQGNEHRRPRSTVSHSATAANHDRSEKTDRPGISKELNPAAREVVPLPEYNPTTHEGTPEQSVADYARSLGFSNLTGKQVNDLKNYTLHLNNLEGGSNPSRLRIGYPLELPTPEEIAKILGITE